MNKYRYDVLCIGSGVSGIMAAISAASEQKNVCIVSKEPLSWGNTRISGGIVASNDPALKEDMLRSGQQLNVTELIDALLSKSDDIHDLVESWGHVYVRDDSGKKQRLKPGGHKNARTYISIYQGISLANALRSKLLESDIDILEEIAACHLIRKNGRVQGIVGYDWTTGEWSVIYAKQTILATGGAGMLYYPHTDNMRSATGDGYALALKAGAALIDMEQVQFIPFGTVSTEGKTGLEIGDTSAAGPYGILKNDAGEPFLTDVSFKTREEVSRKIALEMKRTGGDVWLDPTDNLKDENGKKAWERVERVGSLDAVKFVYGSSAYRWRKAFKVVPTQHYMMGGVCIDHKGATSVNGLYAVGEVAGGLHGGGRLGSMSLFEGLVFGRIVGHEAAQNDEPLSLLTEEEEIELIDRVKRSFSAERGEYSPFSLKKELARVMWNNVGILRDQQRLLEALQAIERLASKARHLNIDWQSKHYFLLLNAIELQFMLLVAKAIVKSALTRKESRGSHYRLDEPNRRSEEAMHTFSTYEHDQIVTKMVRL